MEEIIGLNFHERLDQRIGRPSRVASVSIRFTEDEAAGLATLAREEGKTLREWAREVLLEELNNDGDADPVFTEIAATRLFLNSILSRLACGQTMTPQEFQSELYAVRAKKHDAARELKQQYADREGEQ